MLRATVTRILRMYGLGSWCRAGVRSPQCATSTLTGSLPLRQFTAGRCVVGHLQVPKHLPACCSIAAAELRGSVRNLPPAQNAALRAARSLATQASASSDTLGAASADASQPAGHETQPLVDQWYDLMRLLYDKGFFGQEPAASRQAKASFPSPRWRVDQHVAHVHTLLQEAHLPHCMHALPLP